MSRSGVFNNTYGSGRNDSRSNRRTISGIHIPIVSEWNSLPNLNIHWNIQIISKYLSDNVPRNCKCNHRKDKTSKIIYFSIPFRSIFTSLRDQNFICNCECKDGYKHSVVDNNRCRRATMETENDKHSAYYWQDDDRF